MEGGETILYDIIIMEMIINTKSEPKVNYEFWVIIRFQYRSTCWVHQSKQCLTLVCHIVSGSGIVCAGGGVGARGICTFCLTLWYSALK